MILLPNLKVIATGTLSIEKMEYLKKSFAVGTLVQRANRKGLHLDDHFSIGCSFNNLSGE